MKTPRKSNPTHAAALLVLADLALDSCAHPLHHAWPQTSIVTLLLSARDTGGLAEGCLSAGVGADGFLITANVSLVLRPSDVGAHTVATCSRGFGFSGVGVAKSLDCMDSDSLEAGFAPLFVEAAA